MNNKCSEHSAQCVRLDHLERRVCVIEKLGVKILVGIGLVFITLIVNIFVSIYLKVPT